MTAIVNGCDTESGVLTAQLIFGIRRRLRPRPLQRSRLHEVDARMKPQNALCPLVIEAAGAFPANHCGMVHAAEALIPNPAIACGSIAAAEALVFARHGPLRPHRRA